MKRKMKILAKHKWVENCTITESVDDEDTKYRRFTATIDGWRGFKIYEGFILKNGLLAEAVIKRVKSIKERIKKGDDSVFYEKTEMFSII